LGILLLARSRGDFRDGPIVRQGREKGWGEGVEGS
jgi:hypothetical protein